MAKRTRLKNLSISELSPVDRPANQFARSVLVKREPGTVSKLLQRLGLRKSETEVTDTQDLSDALAVSVSDILEKAESPEERAELIQETLDQYRDRLLKCGDEPMEEDDDELDDDETPPVTKGVAPVKSSILKGLSAEGVAYMEKLEKSANDALALAKAATDTLSAERLRKRAEVLVGDSNFSVDEVVTLLKRAEGDAAATKAIETLCKRQNELVEYSELFKDLGVTEEGAGEADANSELEKAATAVRKSFPKLTAQQAFRKACEDNPGLYEAWVQEQEEGVTA